MRTAVGVVLGFFSGCLLYLMAMMIIAGPDGRTEAFPLALLVLVVGWAGSSWKLIRGAESTAKVFSRGFLLGAAEWLVMVAIGVGFTSKMRQPNSTGVLGPIVTGAFSFVMAIICLTCFAVSYFWTRTMKPNQPNQ